MMPSRDQIDISFKCFNAVLDARDKMAKGIFEFNEQEVMADLLSAIFYCKKISDLKSISHSKSGQEIVQDMFEKISRNYKPFENDITQ